MVAARTPTFIRVAAILPTTDNSPVEIFPATARLLKSPKLVMLGCAEDVMVPVTNVALILPATRLLVTDKLGTKNEFDAPFDVIDTLPKVSVPGTVKLSFAVLATKFTPPSDNLSGIDTVFVTELLVMSTLPKLNFEGIMTPSSVGLDSIRTAVPNVND